MTSPQYRLIPKHIRKMPLSIKEVSRIIHNAGAERVAALAVGELTIILCEYANTISKTAIDIARYNGRETVKEKDIELAVQFLEKK